MKLIFKIALVLVCAALAVAVATVWRNRVPLNDPPGLMTRLVTYFSQNVAATARDSRFPELRPNRYAMPPEQLFAETRSAVVELGWRIDRLDPGAHRLHAVVTTPWLRFKDDVSIEIRATDDGTSELWVESRSRTGRADYGANLKHVLDLVQNIDARVAAEPARDP